MRIVCINADEGFKAFIETIIPKSYQVIYMILNEDNAHKLSQTDICILSAKKLTNPQKEIIKVLIKSLSLLISFQGTKDFLSSENVVELDYTISKNNFIQFLKLRTRSSHEVQVQERFIDYDISRGYIHDINNKLFIPLSALNTIKTLIEKPAEEFNKEKFLKVKNMAEKSLQEAEKFSSLYRKLYLHPKELKLDENSNLLSITENVFRLLKYKSEKTKMPLSMSPSSNEFDDISLPGSEEIYLQIFVSITAFFLDSKKRNPNSKLKEIQYVVSKKDKMNELYLTVLFNENSEQELSTISQSVDLKVLFATLQACFEAIPKTKLNILKLKGKLIFLFNSPIS